MKRNERGNKKNVPPEIDKPEGADTRHEGQGPSEVEKTAGEGDTAHTTARKNPIIIRGGNRINKINFSDNSSPFSPTDSENESSSKSVHTRPRPMRRSCRIVLADGEGKQKIERCDCGEIPPKHGYYTKFDDYKINVKCTGSRLQTETSVGYKLITVAEKLKERNARSIEKFKSDYEKENEIKLKKANEKEERMEVNQSQEGKEEKAKDKGNAPTKDKHQQEFRNFRDQLMILTSDLEEENQEPRKKQVERTMTKPKPKPVVETTPRETIINKPGPSYEISNKFGPLANSEESNVETGKKIEKSVSESAVASVLGVDKVVRVSSSLTTNLRAQTLNPWPAGSGLVKNSGDAHLGVAHHSN
ncbi:hypothetical protein JTB14_005313 [Gonioctena quinquepunctata]|nr:hypothetical protein JTB14_005313 [Gonioctena quinquepunctata]